MQIGWIVRWQDEEGTSEQNYLFDDLIDWSKSYPVGFDYTPGALLKIREGNQLRNYISPTALSGCPREAALSRLTDYFVLLNRQYATYFGTTAHTMAEQEPREEGCLVEEPVAVVVEMLGGAQPLAGKPDKLVPVGDGTFLLIDFKTIEDLVTEPKDYWIAQLSVYAWMLSQNGMTVSRAFIQQIGKKGPRRTEVPLWDHEKTETYVKARMPLFASVFDGTVTLDTLPPPLHPVLDKDQMWRCNYVCPLAATCRKLAAKGK